MSVVRGLSLIILNVRVLWLGSWAGRTDPPVDIEWSSEIVKILGVFVGSGNVEEATWRPRITALENVLFFYGVLVFFCPWLSPSCRVFCAWYLFFWGASPILSFTCLILGCV